MQEQIELLEEDVFERFWKVYPARKGDRAKQPARVLFEKLVKSGTNPEDIIHGAQKFAALEKDKIGTEFIMQAQRWLRNKRWIDFIAYASVPAPTAPTTYPGKVFVQEGSAQWIKWQNHLKRTIGRGSPCRNFGWWFPSEWPPEEKI